MLSLPLSPARTASSPLRTWCTAAIPCVSCVLLLAISKTRLSIEALANHPISYDDQIVRQILESVIVESKEKIKVVFVGGLEVTQTI